MTSRIGIQIGIGILWLLSCIGPAAAGSLPEKGGKLPDFVLQAPENQAHRKYLEISTPTFRISDISTRLVLIEVIGIYCPQCYRQAPVFNSLYHRIESGNLKGKVKMLGIAAGGNHREIQYLHDQKQYVFPIAPDLSFDIHKQLGEPRTPFTMIVNPSDGKILFTHMGVIEKADALWKTITELLP